MNVVRRLLLTPIAGLLACGPSADIGTHPRAIIDGALEDGHPAVGALVAKRPEDDTPSGSFCSATLIDPSWVLTAAHCIDGARGRAGGDDPETFFLHFFIGSDTGSPETGRWVPAKQIFVHPGYRMPGGDRGYDIAIFELEAPVTDVTPVPIFRGDLAAESGAELLYVGFGQSDGDGNGSGRKRSATLRLNTVNPTVYITSQGGGGVCFGDSGGPGLLDVGGQLHVVGVNSTVFGDPSCYEYSTQIRVDAYASWIDATMGRADDCRTEPALCQCDAACGADGICDNAQCGGDSCPDLYACLRFCRSQLCQVNCLLRSTPGASYALDQLLSCISDRCPSGDPSCVEARCRRENTTCDQGLAATVGEADCAYVHRCNEACAPDDLACQDACFFEATLEAQTQREQLEDCIEGACAGEVTEEARARCAAEACRDRYLTCLPDEACRLAGGSCASDTACVVEPWVASYCVPTLGLEVGEVCDPAEVQCADGAVCLDDGTGPVCREICATGAECEQSFAPCVAVDVPGKPFSIGVCSLACPDADEDGACDDADCHPADPTIHPGAAELCDLERRDEDCDGARNEGCEVCLDGSLSMDCPAPAPTPTLPTEPEEGCTCLTPRPGPSPWLALGLFAPLLVRRRRTLAALALGLLVACGGGEPAPDAGAPDSGAPDAGAADVGFEPWDVGIWPEASIFRVQQGLVSPGTVITLEGLVVTSPVVEGGFFVAEAEGAYHGVWVALEGVPAPALSVGDTLDLTAEIAERAWDPAEAGDTTRTRTELVVRSAADLSPGAPGAAPAPVAATRPELAVADLAERYEGVLVDLGEATVTAQDLEAGRLVVDDLVAVGGPFLTLDLSWLEPGARFSAVRGPLQYEDGAYVVAPRDLADLERAPITFEGCLPDSGYTVCPTEIRWLEARRDCGAQGGRLVVLETPEENLAVGGIARRWFDSAFWIGMSDREEEGDWRWVDGSTLTYDPWGAGEPNNAGNNEDCAHSNWRGDGVWNDLPCGRREPYVCEFPGEGARCAADADCAAGPGTCVDGSCVPM